MIIYLKNHLDLIKSEIEGMKIEKKIHQTSALLNAF